MSLSQHLLQTIKVIILALILAFGLSYAHAAWSPPSASPPSDNTPAPVNVGSVSQTKQGSFGINNFFAAISGHFIDELTIADPDATPDNGLLLDVEGGIGATEYCDQNGLNCTLAGNIGGGGVTQLNAGNGITLTPSPITTTGTVAADVTYVQRRITDDCAGQVLVAINSDGTVDCEEDDIGAGGGDITGVIAGTGLTGGGLSGDVTLNADTSFVQRRVTDSCSAGESIRVINSDGTVVCEPDDTGAGGDSDWTISGTNQYSAVSGNVGIGTMTPASKLDVDGLIAGNQLSIFSGPSYFGGSVGVGTAAPLGPLHVYSGNAGAAIPTASGDDFVVESSGDGGATFMSPTNTNIFFSNGASNVNGRIQYRHNASGGDFAIFNGNNQERFTILGSNGNVGIGTTNPSGKLEINYNGSAVTNERGLLINNTSPNADRIFEIIGGAGIASGSYLLYAEGDSAGENFVVRGDGNVGIGTVSPSTKLEVAGQVKITGGSPGAGKVLTSDAAGLGSWETPAGGGTSFKRCGASDPACQTADSIPISCVSATGQYWTGSALWVVSGTWWIQLPTTQWACTEIIVLQGLTS